MYVRVIVTPNAKKERLEVFSNEELFVSVKEPAQRNLANRRVVALVAHHFKTTENKVRIISGHRSQKKMVSVEE